MPKNEKSKKSTNHANDNPMLAWLIQSGLVEDFSINDADIRVADAMRQKQLYHNTIVLLKSYREIIWIMKTFPQDIAEELKEPIGDLERIIDRLSVEYGAETPEYVGRLRSINKSKFLVDLVHHALTALKAKPKNGERMYNVIYYTYVFEKELTHEQILRKVSEADPYKESMSSRTYYYLRQRATRIISLYLWSSPNKALDAWINLAYILQKMNSQE